MTIGIHTRQIYDRIMKPAIASSRVEAWHYPHLHRLEYFVESKGKPIAKCLTCGKPFTRFIPCECRS